MIPTKFNKLKITQDNGLRKIYLISCSNGPTARVYNNGKVLFYFNYMGLTNQQWQVIQYYEIQNGISLDIVSGYGEDTTRVIQIYVNQKLVISDLIYDDSANTITTINLPKINKNQKYYIKVY